VPANLVFLDTNGWLALLSSSDALHSVAKTAWARILEQGSSVVVTDWVVAETGNGLARTAARRQLATAVALIRASPRARLVAISEPLFQRALDLYASREDKSWGLVDCSSFLVMQDAGIQDTFTNDRHFNQAGFRSPAARSKFRYSR